MVSVIRYHATWCRPCVRMEPEFEQAVSELGVQAESVDIDKLAPEELMEAQITSVPTIVVKNETKQLAQFTGYKNKDELVSRLSSYLQ